MMYHHKATDEDTACLFADVTSGGVGLTAWRGASFVIPTKHA